MQSWTNTCNLKLRMATSNLHFYLRQSCVLLGHPWARRACLPLTPWTWVTLVRQRVRHHIFNLNLVIFVRQRVWLHWILILFVKPTYLRSWTWDTLVMNERFWSASLGDFCAKGFRPYCIHPSAKSQPTSHPLLLSPSSGSVDDNFFFDWILILFLIPTYTCHQCE
jgi:hypothetical protein